MAFDQDLWERIKAINLDAAGAEFPFTDRLARDNGWSRRYAARVVEEYRRFAFLAMRAGHEVTPSDEVDQAWHLHLTYTRHYWGPFIKALGRPLHHGPTAGGAGEKARYRENYEKTLASYKAQFGAAPPSDIWPAPERRFADAPHMRRINSRRAYVIDKNAVRGALGLAIGAVAMLGLASAATKGGEAPDLITVFAALVGIDRTFLILLIIIVIVVMLNSILSKIGKRNDSSGGAGCSGCFSLFGDGDGDSGCGGCGD